MSKVVVWYSTACDSWGVCNEDALLVVHVDDLTMQELAEYATMDNDDDARRLLIKASARIKAAEGV